MTILKASVRIIWLMGIIRPSLRKKLDYANSTETSAPRLAPTALFDAPHMVVFPALAVACAVLAFNMLGDALRDWMDPKTRAYLIVTDLAR